MNATTKTTLDLAKTLAKSGFHIPAIEIHTPDGRTWNIATVPGGRDGVGELHALEDLQFAARRAVHHVGGAEAVLLEVRLEGLESAGQRVIEHVVVPPPTIALAARCSSKAYLRSAVILK